MQSITEFANEHNVSRSMVAYKLFRQQRLDKGTWRYISEQFRDEWLRGRETRRERTRGKEGGANYYTVRRHRLGDALVDVVQRMMTVGALTTTKAGTVLGVKAKNVQSLMSLDDAGRAA